LLQPALQLSLLLIVEWHRFLFQLDSCWKFVYV
jgi:hypothetical protein